MVSEELWMPLCVSHLLFESDACKARLETSTKGRRLMASDLVKTMPVLDCARMIT